MTTDTQPEPFDLRSEDIAADRRAELLRLFPEARTEDGMIDWERLHDALGDVIDPRRERYGMTWPGKADCFRAIQQPSLGTLLPDREKSVDFDTTENLIIEGDNFEVLKLLQKSYLGKVKMIYIDPPYNTGNDFIYPDDYSESLRTYLEYTGQVDAEGRRFSTNPESEGRYHSKWLDMIYPRLYLARNLLSEDGVIFISIDDNEFDNLKKVCNEVFGDENFVATVVWQKVYSPKNSAKHFSEDHDFILVYSRNAETWRPTPLPRTEEADARYDNPDDDPRGPWKPSDLTARNYYSKGLYEVTSPSGKKFTSGVGRYWRQSYESFLEMDANNEVWWGPNGDATPQQKRFLKDVQQGMVPQTLWFYRDVGHTQEAKKELLQNVPFQHNENVLNSVKPSRLVRKMLQIGTSVGGHDIVLDFFSGSASSGHAVLAQNQSDGGNRNFILVQLPEPLQTAEPNMATIFDMGLNRVSNVIKKLNDEDASKLRLNGKEKQDRGFRVFRLAESNFLAWNADIDQGDVATLEKQLELHVDHVRDGRAAEDRLYELLLKSGFPLTTPVEALETGGKTVYSIAEGEMLVCLDECLTLELLRTMAARGPSRVVCLDEGFAGNDQLKTNAVQTFKDKKITFLTV